MIPEDEPCRCAWAGGDPLYRRYHDVEWGVPEHDDRALWEKLVLDGFQAGLSWITILRKREAFRAAFEGFDPEVIARWGEPDILRLLDDAGIIRSRAKIAATIGNARAYLAMRDSGQPFAWFVWSSSGGKTVQNAWTSVSQVPTQTPMAVELSKALKAKGFKFCGPVITYAFLQATGVVNDHVKGCFRWDEVRRMA
ncbi:MAG TPA: DNA-3-methyladenine glycosylase I [Caulobacteraceae bacterium]|jgi:DNA-3-methyladenine glycosylase I|nr:DNA-3-methyladenine glycosylase I [Caulobacteraceae bacterium]